MHTTNPGAMYFFAELNPASQHTTPRHAVVNSRTRADCLRELEAGHLDCIITADPDRPSEEALIFQKKHPRFSTFMHVLSTTSFSIFSGEWKQP